MNDELAPKRVDKAKDNADIRPVDLLRAMATDIERGEITCDGLLLIYANRPKDGPWIYGAYRCGMARDQEVVTLAIMQERTIRYWINS